MLSNHTRLWLRLRIRYMFYRAFLGINWPMIAAWVACIALWAYVLYLAITEVVFP